MSPRCKLIINDKLEIDWNFKSVIGIADTYMICMLLYINLYFNILYLF
jgi:hypothetical protein